MASTQDHLPIEEVRDDLAILKDGGMALILQTTAVNFGLLSEREQLAIIGSFAATLNSLSFSIQIVVRSKRLDVSTYLDNLRKAQTKQTNKLLAEMMQRYRAFIERTVQENDVLDKQFYIVIPLSHLELGVTKNTEGHLAKAATILIPRRDHIVRQLARTGVKAVQLSSEQIIRLFYDYYNPPADELLETAALEKISSDEQLKKAALLNAAASVSQVPQSQINPIPQPVQTEQMSPPVQQPQVAPVVSQAQVEESRPAVQQSVRQQPTMQVQPGGIKPSFEPQKTSKLSGSYVVEELADDYGAIT